MEFKETKRPVQINPLDITESLGYTTFRRDSRKPWTKEEDEKLSFLVDLKLKDLGYVDGVNSIKNESDWSGNSPNLPQEINWEEIGELIGTRKPKDCKKRWANSLDPNLKKGKWTPQEDEQLIASFEKNGPSWQKISLEIPGRTDDQCAKRYIEVLDPNTRDRLRPWTLEEDLSLIRKVKVHGTKWRTISLEMNCRPSLTCRNRWRKIVTDVVRGKANTSIKKEIDSIEGGLSKLEEISKTLKTQKNLAKASKKKRDTLNEEAINGKFLPKNTATYQHPVEQPMHELLVLPEIGQQNLIPELESSSPPKQTTTTEIDWKYTLKDTSGLTLSNGNISSNDLAKQLIENAKRYDLKISIHQHIHHHYAPTSSKTNANSPDDSSSNLSGNNHVPPIDEQVFIPNRHTHFNYLPPMVQPQLESSNINARVDNDLTRILNPSYVSGTYKNKRKLSSSSSKTSRKHTRHEDQIEATTDEHFNYEELEDEMDFWETMRSLSRVVDQNPPKIQQHLSSHPDKSRNSTDDYDLYYNEFREEKDDLDIEELEDNLRDLSGFAGILPFNPS